jgi:hypothetical protein
METVLSAAMAPTGSAVWFKRDGCSRYNDVQPGARLVAYAVRGEGQTSWCSRSDFLLPI